MSVDLITLTGRDLTVGQLERIAHHRTRIAIAPAARERIAAAETTVRAHLARDTPMYGLTRGLGKRVTQILPTEALAGFARQTIRGRANAVGPRLPVETVRAIMVVRLNGLCLGMSGVSLVAAELLLDCLNADLTPELPCYGSIGESDLCQMACLALALLGEGDVRFGNRSMSAGDALAQAGITPLDPGPKDGLGLISSSAVSTATGALALAELDRLLDAAGVACALSFEAFRANPSPLNPAAALARPQPGQAEAARHLQRLLAGSALIEDPDAPRRLQDPLSFRCAAPILGATLAALDRLRPNLYAEINGAGDNPLVLTDEDRILPTGNFHTVGLALALDAATAAFVPLADAILKRCERLLDGQLTELPDLLAPAGVDSAGYAPLMKTAQALVGEIVRCAGPAATVPAYGGSTVEDTMTFAPRAAADLAACIEPLRLLIACECVVAAAAYRLRALERPAPAVAAAFELVARYARPHDGRDWPLGPVVEQVAEQVIASGRLRGIATRHSNSLPTVANLFDSRPTGERDELFIPLVETPALRLEHIVSHGQATPSDEWYDQPRPEWVVLVRGRATLRFEGGDVLKLEAGDHLLIPARSRHRVDSCSRNAIWLALHFSEQ